MTRRKIQTRRKYQSKKHITTRKGQANNTAQGGSSFEAKPIRITLGYDFNKLIKLIGSFKPASFADTQDLDKLITYEKDVVYRNKKNEGNESNDGLRSVKKDLTKYIALLRRYTEELTRSEEDKAMMKIANSDKDLSPSNIAQMAKEDKEFKAIKDHWNTKYFEQRTGMPYGTFFDLKNPRILKYAMLQGTGFNEKLRRNLREKLAVDLELLAKMIDTEVAEIKIQIMNNELDIAEDDIMQHDIKKMESETIDYRKKATTKINKAVPLIREMYHSTAAAYRSNLLTKFSEQTLEELKEIHALHTLEKPDNFEQRNEPTAFANKGTYLAIARMERLRQDLKNIIHQAKLVEHCVSGQNTVKFNYIDQAGENDMTNRKSYTDHTIISRVYNPYNGGTDNVNFTWYTIRGADVETKKKDDGNPDDNGNEAKTVHAGAAPVYGAGIAEAALAGTRFLLEKSLCLKGERESPINTQVILIGPHQSNSYYWVIAVFEPGDEHRHLRDILGLVHTKYVSFREETSTENYLTLIRWPSDRFRDWAQYVVATNTYKKIAAAEIPDWANPTKIDGPAAGPLGVAPAMSMPQPPPPVAAAPTSRAPPLSQRPTPLVSGADDGKSSAATASSAPPTSGFAQAAAGLLGGVFGVSQQATPTTADARAADDLQQTSTLAANSILHKPSDTYLSTANVRPGLDPQGIYQVEIDYHPSKYTELGITFVAKEADLIVKEISETDYNAAIRQHLKQGNKLIGVDTNNGGEPLAKPTTQDELNAVLPRGIMLKFEGENESKTESEDKRSRGKRDDYEDDKFKMIDNIVDIYYDKDDTGTGRFFQDSNFNKDYLSHFYIIHEGAAYYLGVPNNMKDQFEIIMPKITKIKTLYRRFEKR